MNKFNNEKKLLVIELTSVFWHGT